MNSTNLNVQFQNTHSAFASSCVNTHLDLEKGTNGLDESVSDIAPLARKAFASLNSDLRGLNLLGAIASYLNLKEQRIPFSLINKFSHLALTSAALTKQNKANIENNSLNALGLSGKELLAFLSREPGKFTDLTALNLSNCQDLHPADLVTLENCCPNLESLNLNHIFKKLYMTHEHEELRLEKLTKLKAIHLIGIHSVELLNCDLKELHLSIPINNTPPKALKNLNKLALTDLKDFYNPVSLISLAALPITELTLDDVIYDSATLGAIPTLTKLRINKIILKMDFKVLRDTPLKELALTNMQEYRRVEDFIDLSSLPTIKTLTKLELENCTIKDSDPLKELMLSELNLSHTNFNNLDSLSAMKSLTSLNLEGCLLENLTPLFNLALVNLKLHYIKEKDIERFNSIKTLANLHFNICITENSELHPYGNGDEDNTRKEILNKFAIQNCCIDDRFELMSELVARLTILSTPTKFPLVDGHSK